MTTIVGFDLDLAAELNSADKAIILAMIRNSIHYKETNKAYNPERSKYFMDGVWWMQDSFASWQSRLPWLSLRTIQTYFAELFSGGYIQKKIVAIHGGGREAAFYRIPAKDPNPRKCKICTPDETANSALAKCKICGFLENANFAVSSSTINLAVNPANDPPPPSLVSKRKKSQTIVDNEDLALGKEWLDFALKESGSSYLSWTPEHFARSMSQIRKKTNLDHVALRSVFEFIRMDDFWRPNAISPSGLMTKSKNGLLKIHNIIAAMKGDKNYKSLREYQQSEDACQSYDPAKLAF